MSDYLIRVPIGLTTEGLLGRRYLARGIDWVLIAILSAVALALSVTVGAAERALAGGLLSFLVLFIVWIGYGTLLESSPWQATVGKRFMGLRVYDSQGGRLGVLQAAARNLVKDGPFIVMALIPGGQVLSLIWLGAHVVVLHRSRVYQGIHDWVANTWVASQEATTQLHIA